ncbi:YitT family protein [Lihuaxuella thermophila]|uniref:YitT family protein n=1 Tax=Lihuaxuella thermophila TaxID=1173111 RepID=UPI0031397272
MGALSVTAGQEIFLIPNQVGIVGISIMLSHLTGLSSGAFLFVLNRPVFTGYNNNL